MWELDHKEELMQKKKKEEEEFMLSILSFSWSPKNWCFQIVGLEKTLESPSDYMEIKPNQSILKEISTECSLEGLMLKPKLQYSGHLIQRANSLEKSWENIFPWCWKRLKAGRELGGRRWDGWMASPTQWTWAWGKLWKMVQSMGSQRFRHNLGTDQQYYTNKLCSI